MPDAPTITEAEPGHELVLERRLDAPRAAGAAGPSPS